jgi:carboxypeptidase C (cathepsin A)
LNDHIKLKTNPLYIFGESYAGHYIPAFARIIFQDDKLNFINYKGIGIGDGWTGPLY